MTTRIGLFTPRQKRKKGQTSTVTTYVEIATPAELADQITGLGGKRVGLISRDRDGNTEVQGDLFAPDALTAKHLAWITAKPAEFQTRGLFYD
jgi:hypothetical protein